MNFFRAFTVKKTRLSLPAEGLSCLYIQWCAYMVQYLKEGLRKNVSSHRNVLYTAEK